MSAPPRRPRPVRWPQLVAGLLTVSWTVGAPAQASLSPSPRGPSSGPAAAPATAASLPAHVLELNDATRARLESVTGIGPALALTLVQAREDGPFADWADVIARVKGVGRASARRLSAHGLRVRGRAWTGSDGDAPMSSAGTGTGTAPDTHNASVFTSGSDNTNETGRRPEGGRPVDR